MLNKLLESAKPLDEAATKTMCLFASEDKKDIPKAIEIQVTRPPDETGRAAFTECCGGLPK